jgi:acetyl-CoA carboxylase carboxyl transferase subunit alpha
MAALGDALEESLAELDGLDGDGLRTQRRIKFLGMGRRGMG